MVGSLCMSPYVCAGGGWWRCFIYIYLSFHIRPPSLSFPQKYRPLHLALFILEERPPFFHFILYYSYHSVLESVLVFSGLDPTFFSSNIFPTTVRVVVVILLLLEPLLLSVITVRLARCLCCYPSICLCLWPTTVDNQCTTRGGGDQVDVPRGLEPDDADERHPPRPEDPKHPP